MITMGVALARCVDPILHLKRHRLSCAFFFILWYNGNEVSVWTKLLLFRKKDLFEESTSPRIFLGMRLRREGRGLEVCQILTRTRHLKVFWSLIYTNNFPTVVMMIDENDETSAGSNILWLLCYSSFIAMGDVIKLVTFFIAVPLKIVWLLLWRRRSLLFNNPRSSEAAQYRNHLTLVLAAFIVELTSNELKTWSILIVWHEWWIYSHLARTGIRSKNNWNPEKAIEIILK
jgi:hypothetical protein